MFQPVEPTVRRTKLQTGILRVTHDEAVDVQRLQGSASRQIIEQRRRPVSSFLSTRPLSRVCNRARKHGNHKEEQETTQA